MADNETEQERSAPNAPRLGLHTCEDLFDKLRWEFRALEQHWDSPYLAFNFAVTAHHLFADWIKRVGTKEQRRRINRLPGPGRTLFAAWRDVTNASKHWELDEESKRKQVISDVSAPEIADWHAYFISGPVVYITIQGGKASLSELAAITLSCFEWILESAEQDFPPDLERRLKLMFGSVDYGSRGKQPGM